MRNILKRNVKPIRLLPKLKQKLVITIPNIVMAVIITFFSHKKENNQVKKKYEQ